MRWCGRARRGVVLIAAAWLMCCALTLIVGSVTLARVRLSARTDADTPQAVAACYGVPHEMAQTLLASRRQLFAGTRRCSDRFLFVHPQNGFGNRMRAALSGLLHARNTGRIPVLVWTPDAHCNATLDDLFDTDAMPWLIMTEWPYDPAALGWDVYDYMYHQDTGQQWAFLRTGNRRHAYFRSDYMARDTWTMRAAENALLRFFVPSARVRSAVDVIGDVSVTIHARSAPMHADLDDGPPPIEQYGFATLRELMYRREMNAPAVFEAHVRSLQDQGLITADQRMFVSGDSGAVVDAFESAFGAHRVVSARRAGLTHCDTLVRTSECVAQAFAEVLLCARSHVHLASTWSSLDEISGRYREFYNVTAAGVHVAGETFAVHTPHAAQAARTRIGRSILATLFVDVVSLGRLDADMITTAAGATGIFYVAVFDGGYCPMACNFAQHAARNVPHERLMLVATDTTARDCLRVFGRRLRLQHGSWVMMIDASDGADQSSAAQAAYGSSEFQRATATKMRVWARLTTVLTGRPVVFMDGDIVTMPRLEEHLRDTTVLDAQHAVWMQSDCGCGGNMTELVSAKLLCTGVVYLRASLEWVQLFAAAARLILASADHGINDQLVIVDLVQRAFGDPARVVGLLPPGRFVNGLRLQRLTAADNPYIGTLECSTLECMPLDVPYSARDTALVHFNWLTGAEKRAEMVKHGLWSVACDIV